MNFWIFGTVLFCLPLLIIKATYFLLLNNINTHTVLKSCWASVFFGIDATTFWNAVVVLQTHDH